MDFQQKTIESFFEEHGVKNPDKKAKLLPILTGIIYDYNMEVVNYGKEQDEYKKNQAMEGIKELEQKITDIFTEEK